MKDVYEGNSLMVEHTLLGDLVVDTRFVTSSGEKMVHVSEKLLSFEETPWYLCMTFSPLNPWLERFDGWLYPMFDVGLTHERLKRAR